ncbi:adenosine receptor A2a-like [Apostichopus japonicus]|uniref:adenosine receptor A2a-like n=1 Tax=Stichopus japonicus TaxID=307972 RepID=UPI003AB68339
MMNFSNNTSHMEGQSVSLRLPITGSIIYVAVYIPVILLCVSGNALVLTTFIRFKKVRKVNNYYIFALAIVDFLTGLVAMPLAISNRLIISETTCHANSRSYLFLPAFVLCATSMCMLLAITVDRYIAISRPLRYHVIMTRQKTTKIIIFCVAFGFCFGTLPVWSFGSDPNQWVCELEQYDAPILTIHALVAAFVIPLWLLLLIIAYVRIFYIAYLRKDAVSNSRSQRAKSVQWKMRTRTTITSAFVLGSFTIFWLPHSFKNIFEIYLAKDLKSLLAVQTFCEMLTYISSFMNPIIYGWRNHQFRIAYKQIREDCGCFQGNKPEQNSASPDTDETGSINLTRSMSSVKINISE